MQDERQLLEQAEFHSAGKFTLDPKLAVSKLRSHMLQPEDSLLYLLQSAVCSGASWMRVDSDEREISVEFDGMFPSRSEAAELLDWAIQSEDVARNRLGLAVASLLTPPAHGVELDFCDGASLKIRGSKEGMDISSGRFGPAPLAAGASGRVRIPRQQSWWRKFWGGAQPANLERLRERSRFAPLRLTIVNQPQLELPFGRNALASSWVLGNKQSVVMGTDDNSPIFYSDHHVLECRLGTENLKNAWLALPVHSLASHLFCPQNLAAYMLHRRDGRGQATACHACRAVLAWRVDRRARVEVVQYGVSLSYAASTRLPHGLWILMADDQAQTDLSRLKLTQSDQLEKQVDSYHQQFNQLLRSFEGLTSQSRNATIVELVRRAEQSDGEGQRATSLHKAEP
ncbi:MAG: hypothetical protein U0931_28900 [Vulcanimicrobiota bacterium]